MSSANPNTIYELPQYLKADKLKPVYCLCGEDLFELESARKKIEKAIEPLVESDFDKETINAGKTTEPYQITDLASAFPFGAGKKLIIVKNFEEIKNKKQFAEFVNSPPDFLVLVLINSGKVSNYNSEPWKSLIANGQLFEAKNPRKHEWAKWLVERTKKYKLSISAENAQILIETVGDDKSLLDMQIRKFSDFLGEGKEITPEVLERLTSSTKEFTIFNLQDALSSGDKSSAIKIGYNLLDNGKEMGFIIPMLSKYISTISQSAELKKMNLSDAEAAKKTGSSYYYYINCKNAKYFQSDVRLFKAAKALLNADLTMKTSAADPKTIFSILISEMIE